MFFSICFSFSGEMSLYKPSLHLIFSCSRSCSFSFLGMYPHVTLPEPGFPFVFVVSFPIDSPSLGYMLGKFCLPDGRDWRVPAELSPGPRSDAWHAGGGGGRSWISNPSPDPGNEKPLHYLQAVYWQCSLFVIGGHPQFINELVQAFLGALLVVHLATLVT